HEGYSERPPITPDTSPGRKDLTGPQDPRGGSGFGSFFERLQDRQASLDSSSPKRVLIPRVSAAANTEYHQSRCSTAWVRGNSRVWGCRPPDNLPWSRT